MKSLGIIGVGFDIIDQLLIRFLHSPDTGKNWEYNEILYQLFIDLKKPMN
jgi:hypothetical protein